MNILKVLFAAAAFGCISWSQCAAQCRVVPDQGQIFSTTGILDVGTDIWSQSITAGRTGQLTGIEFQIENPAVLPTDFAFSIHEGGNPTMGQPLYSQLLTITSADLEDPGLYTWDVTDANLFFDQGGVFTFSFSVQTPGIEIAGNGQPGPGYDGGELFRNGSPQQGNAIRDMAFITYVCADIGPICSQLLKALPKDGSAGDYFGRSVAFEGNIAIVGATGDDDNGDRSGSAYLFDVSTGQQLFKLLPSDGAATDFFGGSVAISGNIAIVSATGNDDNGVSSGSAYLFDVSTGQQLFKLLPSDGAEEDRFGRSVAFEGNIAIVGATGDDDNGNSSGSAYLFDVSTGQQLFKLLPSDGAEKDFFGTSVAISGDIAIVGASGDDDNGTGSGSAYLFDVSTGQQLSKLLPSDGAEWDLFGSSCAISGNIAIFGAPDPYREESGSAYLFDVSTRQQLFKLSPNDGANRDEFGRKVAISGNIAIVGALYDDDNGEDSGSAYLFDVSTGQTLFKLLPSDGAEEDRFGNDVAISGNTAIVGAYVDDDNGVDSGSAYLFDVSDCLPGEPITSVPDAVLVTRGNHISGGVIELAASDNADLSIRRSNSDIQSRTEFEVKGVSPVASPSSLEVTLEGSVFARSQVNQTIELFDYVANVWELIDTREASRFTDSTVTVAAIGDLSRFVEAGTMCIQARIRYQSPAARQQFSSNSDQFIWTIGQ